MAYRFHIDERVEQGVRRIAGEQLDEMFAELADETVSVHQRVHSARKHCKKIRGLLRLVRSGLGQTYRVENGAIRDAGRLLSSMRDSQTMIDAFKKHSGHPKGALDDATTMLVHDGLVRRQHAIFADATAVDDRMREFRERLYTVRLRVDDWSVDRSGKRAILNGFKRIYARGQRTMATACLERTAEAFHEWRKRVKDHWTHILLLEELWPPVMTAYGDQFKKLSDLLGDDHDLAVIAAELQATPSDFGGPDAIAAVGGFAARLREQLQRDAQQLGELLYADKPKQVGNCLSALWSVWGRSK